jgi:hypothetical protein
VVPYPPELQYGQSSTYFKLNDDFLLGELLKLEGGGGIFSESSVGFLRNTWCYMIRDKIFSVKSYDFTYESWLRTVNIQNFRGS